MIHCHAQVHMPKLKPAKKAALEKLLQDSMSACLEKPFIEAAQADKRRSLRAMSQAWISYMATIQVAAYPGTIPFLSLQPACSLPLLLCCVSESIFFLMSFA